MKLDAAEVEPDPKLLRRTTCARNLSVNVFVSHRSGETINDFIADLTVGLRAGHLKSGAPARGKRVAKYNRLMDIEDELLDRARRILMKAFISIRLISLERLS